MKNDKFYPLFADLTAYNWRFYKSYLQERSQQLEKDTNPPPMDVAHMAYRYQY